MRPMRCVFVVQRWLRVTLAWRPSQTRSTRFAPTFFPWYSHARMDRSINTEKRTRDVVVIGASAGGIEAVIEVLSQLPADLPATIGVVIHRGARSTSDWSAMLGSKTRLRVVEPADGDYLAHGVVYVAPSDFHLIFAGGKSHLEHGRKINYTRPAVDPLFISAALEYKSRVVGVVLTGGGQDGLRGLIAIKAAGGISLAQKPTEAQHASMPTHAIIGDHVDAVLSLDEIGATLALLANGSVVQVHA